jgi:hypothetical protein
MDANTQTLVAELISEKIVQQWQFWILFIAFSCVTAIISAYLKAYAGKKGEQMATKEDFASLTRQLSATTQLTEEIKTEIGHIEWQMREKYTTRRAKIEEFVQQIGTVASTCEPWTTKAMSGDTLVPVDNECLNRLEMLARLYFPALHEPTTKFTLAWRNIIHQSIASAAALHQVDRVDLQRRQEVMAEALRNYDPLYREALACRSRLEETVVATMGSLLQFSDEKPRALL